MQRWCDAKCEGAQCAHCDNDGCDGMTVNQDVNRDVNTFRNILHILRAMGGGGDRLEAFQWLGTKYSEAPTPGKLPLNGQSNSGIVTST